MQPDINSSNAPTNIEANGSNSGTPHAKRRRRAGAIISITGGQALVMLDNDEREIPREACPSLGAIIAVEAGEVRVFGVVSAMNIPAPSLESAVRTVRIFEIDLVGEIVGREDNKFRRGVSHYPRLGDAVRIATIEELRAMFSIDAAGAVRIGAFQQDKAIPAMIDVETLFSRHCAIVGATGSGKSYAVAVMVRAVLDRFPNGHIVVFDAHNEYTDAFDDYAVLIDPRDFALPYWMLNFEELCTVLFPKGEANAEERNLLAELLPVAKTLNKSTMIRTGARMRAEASTISADTPLPYRISDIIAMIDKSLGELDSNRNVTIYRRLRSRLQSATNDARFSFLFDVSSVQDQMSAILSDVFRIPVDGKPVAIVQLAGLPEEVSKLIVTVFSRLAFEFGQWSHGAAPVALICEDAHHFAGASGDEDDLSRRMLRRIAKQGRKVGVALWAISQRPTELDPSILSQCNTIFAMRLGGQGDIDAVQAASSDASVNILSTLTTLSAGEAIAIGEGAPFPTRIVFDPLPQDAQPRSVAASFTDSWSITLDDGEFITSVIEQWRAQRMIDPFIG